LVSPDLDRAWIPMGGEPIVGNLEKPLEFAKAAAAEIEGVRKC